MTLAKINITAFIFAFSLVACKAGEELDSRTKSGPANNNAVPAPEDSDDNRGVTPLIDENGCDLSEWYSTDYRFRRPLAISTPKGANLDLGYSFEITIDHQEMVAAAKSKIDGSDIVIAYLDENCVIQSVPRVLHPDSTWNSRQTNLWFISQAVTLADNLNTKYYLYYGNNNASLQVYRMNEVFVEFQDFSALPDDESFVVMREGEGTTFANGDAVISATPMDEMEQYTPYGIFRRGSTGRPLPSGTIVESSITMPIGGMSDWKATIGAPSMQLGLYQNRVQYYTPEAEGGFWTPVSEALFNTESIGKTKFSMNVQPERLILSMNDRIVGTRVLDTETFQPRFTATSNQLGAPFEFRIHYYIARKAVQLDEQIVIKQGAEESN